MSGKFISIEVSWSVLVLCTRHALPISSIGAEDQGRIQNCDNLVIRLLSGSQQSSYSGGSLQPLLAFITCNVIKCVLVLSNTLFYQHSLSNCDQHDTIQL